MPSYQFVTYEVYNVNRAQAVINEAMRVLGYCPHVKDPQPPTILFGQEPQHMLDELRQRLSTATTTHVQRNKEGKEVQFTRAIRSDRQVLFSGVISIPRDWDTANPAMAKATLEDAVKELKRQYGDRLRSVLMHNDETNRHLHFYVYDDNFDLSKICTATAAEIKVDPSKKASTGTERRIARDKALVEFQDTWFNNVFSKYGFSRVGPRRSREPRKVALARRTEREAVAKHAFQTKILSDNIRKAVAGVCATLLVSNIKQRALELGMTQDQKLRHAANEKRAAIAAGHLPSLSSIGL